MSSTDGSNSAQDITLRDVVNRMMSGFQEINIRMDKHEKQLALFKVEVNRRFDDAEAHRAAIEEDLMAAISDTVKIRKYVGMSVPDEG